MYATDESIRTVLPEPSLFARINKYMQLDEALGKETEMIAAHVRLKEHLIDNTKTPLITSWLSYENVELVIPPHSCDTVSLPSI